MADGKKKIFISWSKSQSKRVARVLNEYLPEILDGVELFMSDKDIDPGERSMKVIESQLDGTSYGLLVVTSENQSESWLNFEAGAMSKQVGRDAEDVPRVVPVLVDIQDTNQLTGPISQFQAVKLDEDGLGRIISSICQLVGSDTVVAARRFKRTWIELKNALDDAKRTPHRAAERPRSIEDKVDEVLKIVRGMERDQTPSVSAYESEPIFRTLRKTTAHLDDILRAKYGSTVIEYSRSTNSLTVEVRADSSEGQIAEMASEVYRLFPDVNNIQWVPRATESPHHAGHHSGGVEAT